MGSVAPESRTGIQVVLSLFHDILHTVHSENILIRLKSDKKSVTDVTLLCSNVILFYLPENFKISLKMLIILVQCDTTFQQFILLIM